MSITVTVKDGSKIRMKPMPHQEDINPSMNIQCDKSIRDLFPIGTMFTIGTLQPTGKFYKSYGGVRVASNNDIEDYITSTGYNNFESFKNSINYPLQLPNGIKQKVFEVDLTTTDINIMEIF